jgi:hypothetical protein
LLEAPERLHAAYNAIAEPDEVPTLPQPCLGPTKWPEYHL